MSIAEKLKARGLGIKYSKLKQNAHDPHSAPYRQPSAKEDYKDPIKDFRVYPANEEPDQDIGMFIRLHTTVRALAEDNMREVEDNYYKHTLGMSSYLDKSEGEFEAMKEYFVNDPLGLKVIDTNDTKCWKFVRTSGGTTPLASFPPHEVWSGHREEDPMGVYPYMLYPLCFHRVLIYRVF